MVLKDELNKIVEIFKNNAESIDRLMNLDDDVLLFCTERLQKVKIFVGKHGISGNHPACNISQILEQIQKIHENKSLKPRYETMLNQCIVLLVSYFGSAVQDIFELGVTYRIINKDLEKLADEELKLSLGELKEFDFDISGSLGKLLIINKEISFQDMHSIARAFSKYIGFEIEKDQLVNNIILVQACRHSIVHFGGICSDKTIKQLASASPRSIKIDLKEDSKIQFQPEEIRQIFKNMDEYIGKLQKNLEEILS